MKICPFRINNIEKYRIFLSNMESTGLFQFSDRTSRPKIAFYVQRYSVLSFSTAYYLSVE